MKLGTRRDLKPAGHLDQVKAGPVVLRFRASMPQQSSFGSPSRSLESVFG